MNKLYGEYDHFGICIFCGLPASLCECTEENDELQISLEKSDIPNQIKLGKEYSPYNLQIEKLSWVINNWDSIKEDASLAIENFERVFDSKLSVVNGLCDNCNLWEVAFLHRSDMFRSFPKTSGGLMYPLEQFETYGKFSNFTETPERLELAVHCLEFLMELNN